jgi:O-antigen/teichoic acid export membrane protein
LIEIKSEIVDSSIKQAAKGTSLVVAGTVISTLLLLAIKILIARNTTREELGVYTLCVGVVSVLSLTATLGAHEGIARYVALFMGKACAKEADLSSRAALQITFISSILVGLGLYLFADILSLFVFKNAQLVLPLKIISVSIPFFVMTQVLNGVLRGHNIILSKIYVIDLGIPFYNLAFLSLFILIDLPFPSIIYAYLFSLILGFMTIWHYGYKKKKLNPFRFYNAWLRAKLLRFSFPLLIGIFMTMIMKWTGILLLGRHAGPNAVGIFDVGNSIALLLMFPLAGLEFVFLPIASSLYGQGQSEELTRTYQVLTKWIFSVSASAFIILFLFPEQVITILFGERFIDAAPIVRILASGFLFHSFWGPNGIIMVVVGMSREITYVSIFGALFNFILNFLLISIFPLGIIGAAFACILTYVALNALVSFIIYKKSGTHPFTWSYFKTAACAAFMGFSIFLLSRFLPDDGWLLPFYFFLFCFGYIYLLIATRSIDKEDISLFEMLIEIIQTRGYLLKPKRSMPIGKE